MQKNKWSLLGVLALVVGLVGFVQAEKLTLYFEAGKSGLSDAYKASALKGLKASKGTITVSGHAWKEGTKAGNQMLSEHRASNVRNYLIEAGINRKRIKVVSYGDKKPATKDAKKKDQNQRVEIVVIK